MPFQQLMNWKITTVNMPPLSSGSTMRTKQFTREQPSMRAASSISSGTLRMKPCSMMMAKGMPPAPPMMISVDSLLICPSRAISMYMVIVAAAPGSIWVMMKNIMTSFEPLNLMRVST